MVNVRALDVSDWQAFKAIRLEAVRLHEGLYLANYERDKDKPDEFWQEHLVHDNKRIFGLFNGDTLIGIGSIFTWRDDPSGKTAVLAMGYIREAYRGRKLSRLLYQARIDWARGSGLFERIVVSHRAGNEPSRRANKAFGFVYTSSDDITFGDGTTDTDYTYEMRLR